MFVQQRGSIHIEAPQRAKSGASKANSSLNEFKYILLFEGDIELSEQRQILPFERTTLVVPFLILNVANNCVEL